MTSLPFSTYLLLVLALVGTAWFFYFSNNKPNKISFVILVLCLIQCAIVLSGFYDNSDAMPPRFMFVVIPSVFLVVYGLRRKQRDWILEVREIKWSTLLHVVRIPVELMLYSLAAHEVVPVLMTFEGRNFDILIGVSAPIVAFLYARKTIGDKALLIWNYVGLFFVLFIFVNAALSIESPMQQFAFDQPNQLLKKFPFLLLAVAIVPTVVWTHISDIFYLSRSLKNGKPSN